MELVRQIGVYPVELMDDFSMVDYVFEHETWFLENLKQVALVLDDKRVFRLMDAYGNYVICWSRFAGITKDIFAPVIAYVTSAKGVVRASRRLFDAHFYDNPAGVSESFLEQAAGPGNTYCADIQQVDVRMISNGLVHMF